VAYVLVLIVLAGAIYTITGPLRAARRPDGAAGAAADVAELEAARDAKYRELRDAELDVRTEAVEILHQLDEARSHEQIPSSP
jgi:hypothetical protein